MLTLPENTEGTGGHQSRPRYTLSSLGSDVRNKSLSGSQDKSNMEARPK